MRCFLFIHVDGLSPSVEKFRNIYVCEHLVYYCESFLENIVHSGYLKSRVCIGFSFKVFDTITRTFLAIYLIYREEMGSSLETTDLPQERARVQSAMNNLMRNKM